MRSSKVYMGKSSGNGVWIVGFGMSSVIVVLMVMWRPWFIDHDHHQVYATLSDEDIKIPIMKNNVASKGDGCRPPVLAYWICGSHGDSNRMVRLLKAIYHPRNQYLLQLDSESSDSERKHLAVSIESHPLFRSFGNVNIVGKSYGINTQGSSALAAILHAAALLLKLNSQWDWFINLSPADYPLMTQDDLLHALSSLPRNVNFINYFSESDWKKRHNIDQVVVDPSLYVQKRSDLLYAVERRRRPNAFKIFGGSPWMILTRGLIEYCVQGWENLPRKLVMYFNNVENPLVFYFHTVICNSPDFQNKTNLNTELIRYNFNANYEKMVASGAAFATPFKQGDYSLLNKIDQTILSRLPDGVVAGNWCLHPPINLNHTNTKSSKICSTLSSPTSISNIDTLKPGIRGKMLAFLLSQLQLNDTSSGLLSLCHNYDSDDHD